jgi:hypothetical protein
VVFKETVPGMAALVALVKVGLVFDLAELYNHKQSDFFRIPIRWYTLPVQSFAYGNAGSGCLALP